jgi:hypothetical protein
LRPVKQNLILVVTRQRIEVADRSRWSLILGSSRRRLRPLLAQLKEIDLFVHDSVHTERNVRFELESVRRHLAPGGTMIIDDLDTNWALRSFVRGHPTCRSLICESEPVPDLRRFNGGLFGIISDGAVLAPLHWRRAEPANHDAWRRLAQSGYGMLLY